MKRRTGAAQFQRRVHAMRGFGFIGGLLLVVLLFVAGAIGFGLGQGTVATTGAVAGAPVVYYGHPGFFGFGIFGFLIFLFVIFAVIRIFSRAAWGHRGGGWGHHGDGYYGRGWDKSSSGNPPMPPFADEMLGRWHREAHGQPTTDSTGRPTTGAQPASGQPTTNPTDNKPYSQG
jgi:hypothetical protein